MNFYTISYVITTFVVTGLIGLLTIPKPHEISNEKPCFPGYIYDQVQEQKLVIYLCEYSDNTSHKKWIEGEILGFRKLTKEELKQILGTD